MYKKIRESRKGHVLQRLEKEKIHPPRLSGATRGLYYYLWNGILWKHRDIMMILIYIDNNGVFTEPIM